MFKKLTFFLILVLLLLPCRLLVQAQNSPQLNQQINEFSLAGYGEKGKKRWDISGKSADISEKVVKLDKVESNLYGEKENIKLTADKGDFDKTDGKVHLEKNVVITTSSGAKLTTESLDWDKKSELVSTKDTVNIKRDNISGTAQGAKGHPNLNQVTLEKEVKVDIEEAAGKVGANRNKTIITCDGPLEIDYAKNMATFKNNVRVETRESSITSDVMEVFFVSPKKEKNKEATKNMIMMGTQIDKIVCQGNVKITDGENVSYSEVAIYNAREKKITLAGRPRLVINSTEGMNASSGN